MKDKEFHLTHRRVTETSVSYSESSKPDFNITNFLGSNTTVKYELIGSLEEDMPKALAETRKPHRDSVIQECLDVIFKEVKQRYLYHSDGMTEEFMAGHYAGALLCCVKIREHFGIKGE